MAITQRFATENYVESSLTSLLQIVYPIGAIYLSVNDISPASLFGGIWEQIEDTFLLAAGNTYAAGTVGGEAEHTLTESEMPKHNHQIALADGEWAFDTARTAVSTYETVSIGWMDTTTSYPTGGGKPHNNMPPYLTVYMWKRIE